MRMRGFVFILAHLLRRAPIRDTMAKVPLDISSAAGCGPRISCGCSSFSALALVSTDPTPQEIALLFGLGTLPGDRAEG